MFDPRRPISGRLFYLLLTLAGLCIGTGAQGPATTTVSDTVYRADGLPASGTLLISWSTFTTSQGTAIAAGTKSVTLGTGGVFSVALVPNAGASPSGSVYVVVYQLSDGSIKTEYWIVPISSPAALAEVRTTLGSGNATATFASRQYVDSAVAAKASDAAVVHTSGTETIAGIKQFSSPPLVPTPNQASSATNKAYVDSAVDGVINGTVANALAASQLSQTPMQCTGSFATGVQANGNANCSTADLIQLAERSQPSGISNFGIFWFDSTCHCPKVISNAGQAVQLGLLNVFNVDANTIEQKNGTNPQTFNFYRTFTDSTHYERLGITYDATSGNYVFKGEAGANGGSVHGIGLWTGSALRWRLSPSSPFWWGPDTDNGYDLGDATHRVRTGYFQTSIVLAGTTLSAVQGNGAKIQLSTGSTTNGHVVAYDSNGNAADSGIALSSLPTTGTLVSGNIVKASGAVAIADAGVAAGPYPSKWWAFPTGAGTASFSASSGKATVYGVHLEHWWTFSKINYKVVAADTAGATYDLGLADRTGAIICHIGNTAAATNFTGTGAHQLNLTATCSGPPGDYYETITCSATSGCATLTATSGNAVTFVTNTDVNVSSAGTLSNFTPPSDSWSWTATAPIFGFQ